MCLQRERDEKQRLIFGVKEKRFEIFAGSLRKVSVRQSTSLTNLLSMQVPSLEYKHKIRGWAAMETENWQHPNSVPASPIGMLQIIIISMYQGKSLKEKKKMKNKSHLFLCR